VLVSFYFSFKTPLHPPGPSTCRSSFALPVSTSFLSFLFWTSPTLKWVRSFVFSPSPLPSISPVISRRRGSPMIFLRLQGFPSFFWRLIPSKVQVQQVPSPLFPIFFFPTLFNSPSLFHTPNRSRPAFFRGCASPPLDDGITLVFLPSRDHARSYPPLLWCPTKTIFDYLLRLSFSLKTPFFRARTVLLQLSPVFSLDFIWVGAFTRLSYKPPTPPPL